MSLINAKTVSVRMKNYNIKPALTRTTFKWTFRAAYMCFCNIIIFPRCTNILNNLVRHNVTCLWIICITCEHNYCLLSSAMVHKTIVVQSRHDDHDCVVIAYVSGIYFIEILSCTVQWERHKLFNWLKTAILKLHLQVI